MAQRQRRIIWRHRRPALARKVQCQNGPRFSLAAKRSQIDADSLGAIWRRLQGVSKDETIGFEDERVDEMRDIDLGFERMGSRGQLDQQGRTLLALGPPAR